MAVYTYTSTGVADEITGLTFVDDYHIEVTFTNNGFYNVSSIMNPEVFDSLKNMQIGQKVLVAINGSCINWINPK